MSSKAKERATREVKNIFEGGRGGTVSNIEMLELFKNTMYPLMSKSGEYPKILVRIGESHKPISISLNVSADRRDRGSVYPVNVPDFAQNALKEGDKYRIIDRSNSHGGGIYKAIDTFSKEEGLYAITYEKEPIFRIEISPTQWVAGPLTIQEYEGISTFKHLFELEGTPKKVTIETSVAKKSRDEKETLVKKLFLEFHNELIKKYQELGMTSVEE